MKVLISRIPKMSEMFISAWGAVVLVALIIYSIISKSAFAAIATLNTNGQKNVGLISVVQLTCQLINGVPEGDSGRLLGSTTLKLRLDLEEEQQHSFEVMDVEHEYRVTGSVILQNGTLNLKQTSFLISAQPVGASDFYLVGGVDIWPVKIGHGDLIYPNLAIRAENPAPVSRPLYYMNCFQADLSH